MTTDVNQMHAHLATLLPRRFRFTDEAYRALSEALTRLREQRRSVTCTVCVTERTPDDVYPVSIEPRTPSDEIARYRAQRDQARTELQHVQRDYADCTQRLATIRQQQERLLAQNAELSTRNAHLIEQVERLEEQVQTFREKMTETASGLNHYRKKLRECEQRLDRLSTSATHDRSQDRFG